MSRLDRDTLLLLFDFRFVCFRGGKVKAGGARSSTIEKEGESGAEGRGRRSGREASGEEKRDDYSGLTAPLVGTGGLVQTKSGRRCFKGCKYEA